MVGNIYLDSLDREIIERVKNDNGIDVTDLSKSLGRPKSTIRYRVDTLEEHAYITTVRERKTRKCYAEKNSLTL